MIIPFQRKVLDDIHNNLDFSLGTHELLFSGSVGSSKSILAAHIIIGHCFRHKKARVLIGRRSLPDLKKTIFQKLIEHLENIPNFILGRDFNVTETTATITFKNGSQIISGSWADKRYLKFRSLELSMAVIEEAVENTGDDYKAISEIRQRVGRLPHIKENMILYCTNPAAPSHELYKYFFESKSITRHKYFSLTEQNPFLPKTYIEQLKRDLPPKEAQRMLYGQWVEIDQERLYYAYDPNKNFKNIDYKVNPALPVSFAFDFNIGNGKPLSVAISQYDEVKDQFHFFDQVVVHGFRTLDAMEEIAARGLLEMPVSFEIHGDATGKARSTQSQNSNYEIIENFLANYVTKTNRKLNYTMEIPRSNPPIRERHNIVNGYCTNSIGESRLFVYAKCKMLDEGLKLTALKKGAEFIEDDSKEYQHITSSAGYRVVYSYYNKTIKKGGNIG
jgi:hypothetical protein